MAKTIENVQYSMIIGNEPPSNDENKVDESINASISKEPNFNVTQSEIQETAKYIKRGHETGIMNDTTRSSIVIRHNGQINVSSNRYAQYKLNPSGKVVEEALESVSLSNRRKIQTDDLIINEHKLNPYLYELTDMKKLMTAYNDNMYVGNFCLFGSVLTMSWEMNLKRYVLIRRPARMPMFSPVLNVPEINKGIGVTDPLKIDEELLAKSTKGFQVHAVVSDAESLIGKEGQARFGTNTNFQIAFTDTNDATGLPGTDASSSTNPTGTNVSGSGAIGGYDVSSNTYNFGIERNKNETLPGASSPINFDVFSAPTLSISYNGNDRWIRIAYLVSAYCSKGYKNYSGFNLLPAFVFAQMNAEMGPLGENGICGGFNSIEECKNHTSNQAYYYGMQNRNFSGLHGAAKSASYATDNDYAKDYAYGFLMRDEYKGIRPYANNESAAEQYVMELKKANYFGAPYENYIGPFKDGIKIFHERLSKTQQAAPAQTGNADISRTDKNAKDYLTGKGVTIIGDSIANGNREIILEQLPNVFIEAKGSRDVVGGYEAAKALSDAGTLGNVVIVELGTNGSLVQQGGYADGTKNLLSVLGNRQIFWVTVYCSYSQYMKDNNNYIKNLANSNSNVDVIDWYSLAVNNTSWFPDGVHPTAEGARNLAKLMKDALAKKYG